ncbi:lipoprotein signal peptidase [Fibrobacterales bacterium]|nr:lipoprotein signal peptidase [Fibrobacterales bacterium]
MFSFNKTPVFVAVGAAAIALDQITKFWANSHFPGWSVQVIGDLLRWTLVYNENAAFSMRPQAILPWLSPTVFFGVLTLIACVAVVVFYRSIKKENWIERLSVVLIISGAIGNFIDRLRIGKVIDWIDCDFPDFIMYRFATFNLADSWVTIGIALLFVSSFVFKRQKNEIR